MKTSRLLRLSFFIILNSVFVTPSHADPRTSASYSVPADIADAGGQRTASPAYTNDGSVGFVTGISTVAAPAQTAKAGYIGQLYEITGLALHTGDVSTLNEGATLQLGASLALDDATTLQLTPSSLVWSVLSGPVSSISTGGLLTAGVVYQDAPAQVQGGHSGWHGTASLTVLESIPDNFGSYAADGLPDDWQGGFFGLNNPQAAPDADPTGGGQNNRFKYIAGLDPLDPASRFRLRIEPVPGQPTMMRVIFSPLVAGRTYTVSAKVTLSGDTFTPLGSISISDAGNERTVTDLDATGATKFYHVEISKP